jgi:hypothetical protein
MIKKIEPLFLLPNLLLHKIERTVSWQRLGPNLIYNSAESFNIMDRGYGASYDFGTYNILVDILYLEPVWNLKYQYCIDTVLISKVEIAG